MRKEVKITAICEVDKTGYICVDLSGNLDKPKHVFVINYETEDGKQGLTMRGASGVDLSYFCGVYENVEETHTFDEDIDSPEILFNSPLLLEKVTDWIDARAIRILANEAEKEYRDNFQFYKQRLIKNIVESKVETEKSLLEKLEKAKSFTDLLYI